VNLMVAAVLATRHLDQAVTGENALAALVGGLIMGLYLAAHFGKVQREKRGS
jgi:hypothetical protein